MPNLRKRKWSIWVNIILNTLNEWDDIVSTQFSDYINIKYPFKVQRSLDVYHEELERERENWF